jgi:hypothetical protein
MATSFKHNEPPHDSKVCNYAGEAEIFTDLSYPGIENRPSIYSAFYLKPDEVRLCLFDWSVELGRSFQAFPSVKKNKIL